MSEINKPLEGDLRLAVVGAGTWGTVLAHIAAPCAQVSLYSGTGKNVQVLREDRRHPKLPGFILDGRVDVKDGIGEELKSASAVILVVPMALLSALLPRGLRKAQPRRFRRWLLRNCPRPMCAS